MAEFDYLDDVARKYGDFYLSHEFDDFIQRATEGDLEALRIVYEEIDKRGDAYRLSRWIHGCLFSTSKPTPRELRFAQRIGQLFVLFDHLGEHGIAPFSSGKVAYIEVYKKPNWDNVPPELHYLAEVAERFGIRLSEPEMLAFLEDANESDLELLARTAERMRLNGHYTLLLEWLDRCSVDSPEANRVYAVVGLMDHAGLSFE
jgi:hypothetical protein